MNTRNEWPTLSHVSQALIAGTDIVGGGELRTRPIELRSLQNAVELHQALARSETLAIFDGDAADLCAELCRQGRVAARGELRTHFLAFNRISTVFERRRRFGRRVRGS